MTKTRLEAFSDGVIAIIITIMVLELKTPHGTSWNDIKPLIPVFASYILSFVMVAIYWGNHHHLLHTVKHVDSRIMWANMHLLFWLSLFPFATAWMGENYYEPVTVATFGGLAIMCGNAYYILLRCIGSGLKPDDALWIPIKQQSRKGIISLVVYSMSVPFAFVHPAIAGGLFILVAIIWLIPDRNIEKALRKME